MSQQGDHDLISNDQDIEIRANRAAVALSAWRFEPRTTWIVWDEPDDLLQPSILAG